MGPVAQTLEGYGWDVVILFWAGGSLGNAQQRGWPADDNTITHAQLIWHVTDGKGTSFQSVVAMKA